MGDDLEVTALDGPPSLFSVQFDLASVGYSVHEHLVTGTATAYTDAGANTDGRWSVEPTRRAEFTTRIVVHRPTDPAARTGRSSSNG